ncbi:anaerobic dimethyl sulfoxide reductase chain A [Escherichia coli]|nr:anaerobic dimethyl sulfoxide reductase chain A [Escherichia coli]
MKTKIPDAVLAAEVSRRGLVKNDSDRRPGNGQQRINITF